MTVSQIFRAECGGQITLLLKDLQVQHYDCKNSEHPCQQIAEHKQHANILQVKAQKCRIATVPVYAVCYEFCAVFVRDTGPPVVLHTENGNQKDQITKHANAEPGKAGSSGQMAPAQSDGQKLRGYDPHGGNPHQSLDCVGLCVFSASELHGLDASALLHPLFHEINAIKNSQD